MSRIHCEDLTKPSSQGERLRIVIRGLVQGVGFRPFVYRLARKFQLKGWVSNTSQGVFIEIEGQRGELEKFLLGLKEEKPEAASIQSLECSHLDSKGYEEFEIRDSNETGEKSALVMPDIAMCGDCRNEILDPYNRRYRYPFTNCTHCGPRYSILEALPYDRIHTTMKNFKMCGRCESEYQDARDRRFHAQPNACPQCGPRLEFWNAHGRSLASSGRALKLAVTAVRKGKIIALKGLGGFQLIASAQNETAVRALRERKHRDAKPFALMAPDLECIKLHCHVSAAEENLLTSPAAPIVLLKRREEDFRIAESAAPHNPYLGFMLPYTPLHHLLLTDLQMPVIATSGNLPDEPIVTDEYEAVGKLGGIADYYLVHDRPIARQIDDSIARLAAERELILRRARGYAPLPVTFCDAPEDSSFLAVGAHLKNTIAQSRGNEVFMSQHIGDLQSEEALNNFKHTIHTFKKLYGKAPDVIVSDLHPEYLSSQYAKHAHLPLIQIQHHYAHVLSCMAENELKGPVLGVCWDGSGLGPDGTIWGGEFLWVDERDYVRAAHFRKFKLPGGDKAAAEPRRSALSVLFEIFGERMFEMKLRILDAFTKQELKIFRSMLVQNLQSPETSSAGRLFDAAAAILGIRSVNHFEGQAAMELEFALAGHETEETYPIWFSEYSTYGEPPLMRYACQNSVKVFDWEALVRRILADMENGIPAGKIAAKFHNTLAEVIVRTAVSVQEQKVVLTGGCFQNKYLLERALRLLREKGFSPYWHQRIPPNDGGIALGQIAGAARVFKAEKSPGREFLCV